MAWRKDLPHQRLVGHELAQLAGAALGAWLAPAMIGMEILQWSGKARTGAFHWLAEAVATAGLLLVILRAPAGKAPALVACYIGAAYWFTASISFANPAAVFGRSLSDSFAGIAAADAPAFVLAQLYCPVRCSAGPGSACRARHGHQNPVSLAPNSAKRVELPWLRWPGPAVHCHHGRRAQPRRRWRRSPASRQQWPP